MAAEEDGSDEITTADVGAATASIGRRLTDARVERRIKVSELARRAGVSASLISQIERGTSKPSVGTLFALAQVLDVPVDSFFSTAEPPERPEPDARSVQAPVEDLLGRVRSLGSGGREPWPSGDDSSREVVRHDDRARLEIRGGVRWERLTPVPLDGIEFLELIYAPGAESDAQSYRHPGVELVLVNAGTMTIYLGFARHVLEPGDSIAFPSSTPHRYVNEGSVQTRATTVILRDDLSALSIRPRTDGDGDLGHPPLG